MNFKLLYNLWQSRRSASPGAEFKNKLWKRLSNSFDAQHARTFVRPKLAVFKWVSAGAALSLLLAGFGTGAYAYNSPSVTSLDALYPIKKAIEQVEEQTRKTPEAKAGFYLKTLSKRDKEVDKIVEKFDNGRLENSMRVTVEHVKDLEEHLAEVDAVLENANPENPRLLEKVRDRLERKMEKRQEWLKKAEQKLQKDSREMILGEEEAAEIDFEDAEEQEEAEGEND